MLQNSSSSQLQKTAIPIKDKPKEAQNHQQQIKKLQAKISAADTFTNDEYNSSRRADSQEKSDHIYNSLALMPSKIAA